MKILLDTHVLLWFIQGNDRLPESLRSLITDSDSQCLVSIASLWEISIKVSLKRLEIETEISELCSKHIIANGFDILEIKPEHLDCVSKMNFHHKDPFDRLIIAQCQIEGIPLISKDSAFQDYEITNLW